MAVALSDTSSDSGEAPGEDRPTANTNGPGSLTASQPPGPARDTDDAASRRDALRKQPSARPDASAGPHAVAEWVTLVISSLIVLSLIGLTTYFYVTGQTTPATIEVEPRPAETYQAGSRYYLPVTVRNTGGLTGEEVRVRVALTDAAGREEAAEFQIQFLAGGGTSRAVTSFGSDPRQGQIDAAVTSYLEP